ncbi:hypothetical protein O6H91_07G059100 [Diphasiastrum complanatum]|uniref:Uncharacterized protein n=1 Tax=Diphasiastrum complanatum TaxID=34168 RepID=A0ACC2D5W2_DIPCM|nr:hypothetical protein O6H91_07G059100 [Diphasiastrum complanatum]
MACSCDLRMDPSQPVDETEKVEDGNKPAGGYGSGLSVGCGLKEVHCIPYLLKEVCVEVPRKHRASYAEAETPAAGSSSKKQRMLGIDLLQFQRTFDENARLQSPIRSLESIKAIDNSEGKASGSYLMDCSNQVVTEEGESMSIKLPHASSETVLHADVHPYQCSQILTICCNGSLKHLQHPLVKSVDSNSRLDSPLARDSDEAARSVKPCFMKGCQVDGTATEPVEITANGGVPCFSSEKGELLPAELLERLHPPKSEVSMQSANGISYVASEKLLPIMTSPPSADETSEARKLLLFQGDVTNEPRELESIMSAQKLSLTNGTLCEECEGLKSMNSSCNLEKLMIQARRSPLPFTMAKSSLQSTVIEVDSKDMLNVRDVGNSGIDINKDSLSGQGEIIEMVILQEPENFPKDVTLHSTNEDSYRPGDGLDCQSVDEAPAEENVLSDAKAGEKTPAGENDLSDAKPDRFYCAKQGFNNETVQEDSCSVVDAPTDNSNCQSDAEDGPRNSTLCSLKDDRSSFSAALQIPSFNFLRSFSAGKANFTFEKHMKSKTSEGDVRDDPLFLQEEHADSGCNLSNAMPSFDDPDTPIDSDISYNSQQSENLRPFPKKVDGNKDIYRGTKCLVSEKNYNGQEMAPAETENSSSPEFRTSEQVETKKTLGTLKDTSGDICQNLPESVKEKRKRLMILAQIEKKGPPTSAKALLATGLLEGKYVRYMARGEVLRLGVIKDSGILCQCSDCKGQRVFNVSGFEKHAGSNARHPSDYIFLGNGKSLKEIIEAGIKVKETGDVLDTIQKVIEEGADRQVCVKCHKGGAILHCVSKSCSRFYHQECVGLHTFPEGKWLCPECLQIDIREPLLERNFLQRRSIHHPEFGLQLKPRDPSLHKALFLPGGLPDGTKLGYYDKGQVKCCTCLLIGTKSGSGICCSCCNQVVSCSQFEVHAGWGARRNPYNCIHLLDGMSLHDVAVQRGNVKSLECDDGPLTSVTGHDHCSKCGLDGELVHCGSCSRAYHLGYTIYKNSRQLIDGKGSSTRSL